MKIDRRKFLETTGVAALTISGAAASRSLGKPMVGICDWNLGASCDPEIIPRAHEAHLRGIQVSVGTGPEHLPLREAVVRERYRELGQEYGITFCSVAAGAILNQIPLKSEPQAAIYVLDALEAAAILGAKNILLAFFGNGDLRLKDAGGELRNLSTGPFTSFELDAAGVTRVVEVLKQVVPRAEDEGIALGLENTLTADQNLEIIERVGSELVQIYYDVGNSTHYGYDVAGEIQRIGSDRICEIHLKDWASPVLGAAEGEVDFKAAAEACRKIGYDKWYVLESSGRENQFLEDTRGNVDYVTRLF